MTKLADSDVQWNDNSSTPQSRKESRTSEIDEGHDIEDVFKIIGVRSMHWLLLLVCGLFLLLVINESLGTSILTIASKCDFQTNSVDQAIMSSASFLGIAFGSYFWGYFSDTLGRRTILIYTTLAGNLMSLISMFLPTYWSFVTFRFFVGIFIAGASSSSYAYCGEFFSAHYRPIMINYACLFIGISMIYFPAISWLILTMDWSLPITDEFSFRPWRLIILSYILPGFIASIMLIFLPESPKYYLSINKPEKAYEAVDWICRHSKGETLANLQIFKIKTETNAHNENKLLITKSSNTLVKMWHETKPLFHRPHFFNLLICCILMMGLFVGSSGMGLWYPTIQNRVGLSEPSEQQKTLCEILQVSDSNEKQNVTLDHCDDTITQKSFIDSINIGVAYCVGYLILGVLINPLGRKTILVGCLGIAAIFAIVLLWIKEPIALLISFGVFLVLPGLSISVLNGAVVELMPTHIRAKAVCIVLMMGRWGTILGSNITGALLETNCVLTFSFFGGFGIFCAMLVFLLPI